MDDYAYVVNVEAAVIRDGEYLVVERAAAEDHAAGMLAFPGGKVEMAPGDLDPIEETARREVAEETGVEVEDVEYVRSKTFEVDPDTPVVDVVTRCAYAGGEARTREPEEVAAVHWLTPDAITEHEDCPSYLAADLEAVEAVEAVEPARDED